jgi:hypothetical protein
MDLLLGMWVVRIWLVGAATDAVIPPGVCLNIPVGV